MSVYGPKIGVPSMPSVSLPKLGKKGLLAIAIIVIAILVAAALVISWPSITKAMNPHISVSWKNNPLDLLGDFSKSAELGITLNNTTEVKKDINLDVTTDSQELIIFCPDKLFENVEPGNSRNVTCIVSRNPNEKIFTGSYTIDIKTNLGTAQTTLQINTK